MEVTDENKMIDQPNLSCDDTLKKKKSCQNSVEKETILREKKTDKDNLLSPGKSKKNRSIPSSPTINLLREMSDKLMKGDSAEKETILREKKTDKDNLLSPGKSKKNRSIPSSPTINLLREMSDKLIKREKTVTFGEYVSFDEDLDVNAKNVRFE